MDFRTYMTNWLTQALQAMGFSGVRVDWEDSILKGLVFNLSCYDQTMLIGRQGSTLSALEQLARAVARRTEGGQDVRFFLDIDDYRRKREWQVKELVRETVAKGLPLGRPVHLPPMNAFERKVVHAMVTKEFPRLGSTSVGQEPNRRVVLQAKS